MLLKHQLHQFLKCFILHIVCHVLKLALPHIQNLCTRSWSAEWLYIGFSLKISLRPWVHHCTKCRFVPGSKLYHKLDWTSWTATHWGSASYMGHEKADVQDSTWGFHTVTPSISAAPYHAEGSMSPICQPMWQRREDWPWPQPPRHDTRWTPVPQSARSSDVTHSCYSHGDQERNWYQGFDACHSYNLWSTWKVTMAGSQGHEVWVWFPKVLMWISPCDRDESSSSEDSNEDEDASVLLWRSQRSQVIWSEVEKWHLNQRWTLTEHQQWSWLVKAVNPPGPLHPPFPINCLIPNFPFWSQFYNFQQTLQNLKSHAEFQIYFIQV